MERITITLETGNDAFYESPTTEIRRILRDLADHVYDEGEWPEVLRDINGNVCGSVKVELP